MSHKTTVGPLVRENQRQTLINQLEDARSKGAKILTGGKIIAGDGYFYEPTIVSNVNHEMMILNEEVFGPAAPIIVLNHETEAIWEANNSEFG
jgi:acyl-CoA reductase-like NAD-dependent aldehyde dehydrogenase